MSVVGIRASGRLGALAKRWLRVLDEVEERLKGRIRRGKTLARSGAVQSLDIAPGTVYADVKDNGQLHRPLLRVRTYEEDEWRKVLAVLGQRLDLLALLLEGDVGEDFLATLEKAGVQLYPEHAELDGDCDCGDYAVPCVHGAAVHHLVAEALEADPMLLLALRGRPREQLIAELRRSWGDDSAAPSQEGQKMEEPAPSGDWFASPVPLASMTFRFPQPNHAPGMLELGPLPGDGDLLKALSPLYEAGAEAARELALAELPTAPRRRRARPSRAPASADSAGQHVLPFTPADPAGPEPDVAEPEETVEVVVAAPVPAPSPAPAPAAATVEAGPAEGAEQEEELGELLVNALAEADYGMSTAKLAEIVGLRPTKVRKELLELESLGVISRTGSTRATRWWLG